MVAIYRRILLVVAALLLPSARAIETYDVIIVGSGPGGLIAAEYLSRDPSIRVLVLEAGGPSLQATGGVDVPGYAANRGYTKFDIPGEYTAAASIFTAENAKYTVDYADDRKLQLAQMVGGSSSVNAALYFRVPDQYLNAVQWPFNAAQVAKTFDELERDVFGTTDTPSTDGQRYLQEAYTIVAGALKNAGYKEVSKLNDMSAVNNKHRTFGHAPFAIKNGLRDSPARTCWGKIVARSNVRLAMYAKVNYIKHNKGTATGVVYNSNVEVAVSSRGTVIMAAGAIGTPKVLIQSGIGPSAQLNGLKGKANFPGITNSAASGWVVNEMVGQNLFDTTMALASFSHPQMTAFHADKKSTQVINDFMNSARGPLTTTGPVLIAYSNEKVNDRTFEYQLTVLSEGLLDQKGNDRAFGAALYVNNPESRDACSFDVNTGKYRAFTANSLYMSSNRDLEALTQYATHIATTLEAVGATFLRNKAQNIKDWVSGNRQYVTNHFGGTCFASKDSSSRRCADEKLRVVGTSNIYIADGSVMKDGTVNPYGFIMYTGREVGNIVKDALAKGPPVTQPPPPSSTKQCTLVEKDVDYIGNDIASVAGAVTSCCSHCAARAGCGAYSWSNYNGGTCFLKSHRGQTKAGSGVTSGVVAVASSKCSVIEGNVDYTGADIGNALSSSFDGCCSLCLGVNNCQAYAWNSYNGGTCYFKSAKGSAVNRAGVYSGTVTRSLHKHKKQQHKQLEIELEEEEEEEVHQPKSHAHTNGSVHVHIRVHKRKH